MSALWPPSTVLVTSVLWFSSRAPQTDLKRESLMALKPCWTCERKFPAKRLTCPYCDAPRAGSGGGLSRSGWKVLAFILALLMIRVFSSLTQVSGPPPELEALHSSEDAIRECREGIESRLVGRGGAVQGSLEAEYLQGGEYFVRGTVIVTEEGSRVTRPVLCEAQFRTEGGWAIEHVEFGS